MCLRNLADSLQLRLLVIQLVMVNFGVAHCWSLSLCKHRTKAFRCCTKCSVLSFNLTTLLVFANHLMALYCFIPTSAQKPCICKVALSLLAIWPDTYYCFVFCFFLERSLSLWCFLDPSYFLLFRLIILSQSKMLESLETPAAKTLWRV